MPPWLLKALACLVTGLAAAGSAAYVGRHLQNRQAPLRPPVVAAASTVHLTPDLEPAGDQGALTFTSVS